MDQNQVKTSIDKMGGALLSEDISTMTSVISYIKEREISGKKIIVVSALKGITRLLALLFASIIENDIPKANRIFLEIRNKHTDRVISMFRLDCRYIIKEMDEACFSHIDPFLHNRKYLEKENMNKDKANLLKYGELCSSIIMKHFLEMFFPDDLYHLDARSCITVDTSKNNYTDAPIDLSVTLNKIDQVMESIHHKVILTEGYISRDKYGNDSLMGFDSSDYSASIFTKYAVSKYGLALLDFWKDVSGVYENPSKESDGVFDNLKSFDYSEFSKENCVPVLPKAIELLSDLDPQKVLIRIRPYWDVKILGTSITS